MLAMPEQVTQRGRELLDALKSNGGWMSRAQLAHATNKKQLSPHDTILLDRMVDAGLVEKRERASNTPIGMAFEYKVKEGE